MVPSQHSAAALFTVPISTTEQLSGTPTESTVQQVATALQQHGVCVLQNLIPTAVATTNYNNCLDEWHKIEHLRQPLAEMYEGHLQDIVPRYQELAPRGPRRYSISTFSSPALRNDPIVKKLMGTALQPGGPSVCWSEETVLSLPGAGEQRIHVDAGHLYDPQVTPRLPCYHYSCFIALCDQSPVTGNTAFALGTHNTHGGGHESKDYWNFPDESTFVDVYLSAGSCVIFDSRLYHRGRANASETIIRPIYGLMFANTFFNPGTSYFGVTSLRDERKNGRLISWQERKESQDVTQEDQDFIAMHASQFNHISVPNQLWCSIAQKCTHGTGTTLDAHEVFGLGIVAGEGDDRQLDVVANRDVRAFEQVWVIEHAWTWEGGLDSALRALSKEDGGEKNKLLQAVSGTVVPMRDGKGLGATDWVDVVMAKVQTLYQSYAVGDGVEGNVKWCYFLPDLLGCHLVEAATNGTVVEQTEEVSCNVCLSPAFVDVRSGAACSFLFPVRDIPEGSVVRIPTGSRKSLAPKV